MLGGQNGMERLIKQAIGELNAALETYGRGLPGYHSNPLRIPQAESPSHICPPVMSNHDGLIYFLVVKECGEVCAGVFGRVRG
jgi:hypothetical protein